MDCRDILQRWNGICWNSPTSKDKTFNIYFENYSDEVSLLPPHDVEDLSSLSGLQVLFFPPCFTTAKSIVSVIMLPRRDTGGFLISPITLLAGLCGPVIISFFEEPGTVPKVLRTSYVSGFATIGKSILSYNGVDFAIERRPLLFVFFFFFRCR